ncbi:hypothetical protein [Streptomyces sp. NPDC056194]
MISLHARRLPPDMRTSLPDTYDRLLKPVKRTHARTKGTSG